jgi:hypothetical protein
MTHKAYDSPDFFQARQSQVTASAMLRAAADSQAAF